MGPLVARVTILVEDKGEIGSNIVSLKVFFDPKPTTVEEMTPALVVGAFLIEYAQKWMEEHNEDGMPVVLEVTRSGGGDAPN